jgi:anthranilate phosphoribosyltransferase
LHGVFVWAYERSCQRYAAVRRSLGEPDPFRLRYRLAVAEMVAEVVRRRLDKPAAAALIRSRAKQAAVSEDEDRLIEVAETELMNLHEGNIARFRIRPSEYRLWQETWG